MSKKNIVTRFTPGPWRVACDTLVVKNRPIVAGRNNNDPLPVCIASIQECLQDAMEKEANATLIAAAPEMYAELEKTASFIKSTAEWLEKKMGNIAIVAAMFYNAEQIEQLLAKARGEKQGEEE